ncbi:hypothetical protein CF67_04064 [Candidatus Photodesmus blepharus]|uniref:Cell division protein ZapE n=1 Tax=Candidatus Photodesmus blepharonis TaxID=1179155 RepID=A0A084CMP6_9GAMM|nr:cell division protein ZapE [Candidatus Photodesmus blepharus]KEY91075.1 hypothetical protein CF67_04064 [Candidatus Photodesmus blepharus]
MTFKEKFQKDLMKLEFQKDIAQQKAINALNDLYLEIVKYWSTSSSFFIQLRKFFTRKTAKPQIPKGVYLWGGVGRGKTYLMDSFYEFLPIQKKIRIHFHRFMSRVHNELNQLKNLSDPLEIVAKKLQEESTIICFDEFFVSDIADAMILATLFQSLFRRGIILVATSNMPPCNLYRNGLNRIRFLPVIDLIKKNCIVMRIDNGVDYRLRELEQAQIYYYPLNAVADEKLLAHYPNKSEKTKERKNRIKINYRNITVIDTLDGILHATFEQLCQTPRNQNDYVEISRNYHTVLLANVKKMNCVSDDATRRFISLVDEFYERNVKLVISAEVKLESLYTQGKLEFEFRRCQSRLIEMQSCVYLSKKHLT